MKSKIKELTEEEFDEMVIQQCRSLVLYGDKVLDVGGFLGSHPGGSEVIKKYIGKQIERAVFEEYSHSNSK